jgi:DNA repair protein RecO (recombination protein O)
LRNLKTLSVETLKYIRHFQRSSYADASRARPSPEVRVEAESLMQDYFTYLLERELNTPGFLKSIRE